MHANRLHRQLSLLAFVGWLSEGVWAQPLCCKALLLLLTTGWTRQEVSFSHGALQTSQDQLFRGPWSSYGTPEITQVTRTTDSGGHIA